MLRRGNLTNIERRRRGQSDGQATQKPEEPKRSKAPGERRPNSRYQIAGGGQHQGFLATHLRRQLTDARGSEHTAYERTRHRPASTDRRKVEVFGDVSDRAGDDCGVVTEYKTAKGGNERIGDDLRAPIHFNLKSRHYQQRPSRAPRHGREEFQRIRWGD